MGDDGYAAIVAGTVSDVTDDKQTLLELARMRERFGNAVAATQDGVFERMADEPAMLVSDRLWALLGYRPGVLPASRETFVGLVQPDDRQRQLARAERALAMRIDTAPLSPRGLRRLLAACAVEPPVLVPMDLQMPVLDGLGAARELRARQQRGELPAFPVVALTAHAVGDDRVTCLAAGMDGYLSRPLLLDTLCAELARRLPPRSVG